MRTFAVWILFCFELSVSVPIFKQNVFIVGGVQANITNFPYQLSVRINGRHMCGGSIIAPQWALTAAHCLINVQASDVSIRAGSAVSTSGGELVQALQIYSHPNFNANNGDYDVALISISNSFNGQSIGSIALPAAGTPIPIGSDATISGWGLTSASESINPILLQSVTVTVLTHSECVQDYSPLGGVDDMLFCAGQSGHDSCQGDSGGPIVVNNVQIGTVSGGIGCANPKFPGLYTNIADPIIRNWIKQSAEV